MRVAVTGTPGTGKTSATNALETDLDVVHLNDVIKQEQLYTDTDENRDSVIADINEIAERYTDQTNLIFESHLSHYLPVDRVIVLRAHPETIEKRLEQREEPQATIRENARSEALDVILSEAVDQHGLDSVYEITTTNRTPEEVAGEIQAVIEENRSPNAGKVSYLDYIDDI